MRDVIYLRPKDVTDAVQLYRTTPGCRPLAGGTDLMVMLHARTLRPRPRAVLDLWSLQELKGIRRVDDTLEIGAAEPYTGIIRSTDAQRHLPALVAAARTIGAAQIQNRGTLGGNLANASPAGDTLPVLLAYDAVVVTDRRSIPIDGFFTGYRKTALQSDELIVAVRFPIDREVTFRKVGTRAAQAISKASPLGRWRKCRYVLVTPRRPWPAETQRGPWRPSLKTFVRSTTCARPRPIAVR